MTLKQRFAAAGLALAVGLAASGAPKAASDAAPPKAPVAPGEPPKIEWEHTETEQVRLVMVPTVVTDHRGRPVRGLTARDFKLLEDNVPQKIDYLTAEADEQFSIAFLLDVSGSMRSLGRLDAAKVAIGEFVNSLRPGDQMGLVCFADEQVEWVTPFTADRKLFLKRLMVQEGYGQTALFDALAAAPRLVRDSIKGRRAIVLFTDGIDTASKLSMSKAIQLARSVNVPIYTVAFGAVPKNVKAKGTEEPSHRLLERFSAETGGLMFVVHEPEEAASAAATIDDELRFHYLIGYYPTSVVWDGSFRRLEVETKRRGLTIRTRSGYYANP